MAKKEAIYANYELRVEDGGKIVIQDCGQILKRRKENVTKQLNK